MNKIKCLILDVDGTMTDSGVYYDENGNELKKFCTKDAAGIFAAQKAGIVIIVMTGRECKATERRVKELNIDFLYQNIKDKAGHLKKIMNDNSFSKEDVAYIGDDLNDIPPMKLVGYVGCPKDSSYEVKKIANYISCYEGGHGAVKDIIERILRDCGEWEKIISELYDAGI